MRDLSVSFSTYSSSFFLAMRTVFTSIRKQLLWTKPLWCIYLGPVSSSCLPLPRTAIHHSHSGGMVAGEWCAMQSLTEAAQHRCAENAPLGNLAALFRLCFFFPDTQNIMCSCSGVWNSGKKPNTEGGLCSYNPNANVRDGGARVCAHIHTCDEQIHFAVLVNMRPRPRVCVTAC